MKIKFREMTNDQLRDYCIWHTCDECPFNRVACYFWQKDNWTNNKDLYGDKFLDQEIELEDEKDEENSN